MSARPENATIKRLLARRFPATTFRVYNGRGTGRCWSHIAWTDGPSTQLVESFLATIQAAPGTKDLTDYFAGERVIVTDRGIHDGWFVRLEEPLDQRLGLVGCLRAARLLPALVVAPI